MVSPSLHVHSAFESESEPESDDERELLGMVLDGRRRAWAGRRVGESTAADGGFGLGGFSQQSFPFLLLGVAFGEKIFEALV